MKTFGIIIIICIALYALFNNKTSTTNQSGPVPLGLETALDNQNNKQKYPIGNPADFEQSLNNFKNFSQEAILSHLENEEMNLYEVSNALLVLANHYLQKPDIESGLPILESAAYNYHNPFAMVTLAKAYFHGFEAEPSGTVPVIVKDLEKAYYLINRSFETAGTTSPRACARHGTR